jgi:XTP/dITP diphosphohydrolase
LRQTQDTPLARARLTHRVVPAKLRLMHSRQPLVLASRNRKKSREVAEILAPHGIELVSIADFPQVGEVVEDGATFAENAAKKAAQPAKQIGRWVIGEDSGLVVDALAGRPGVYSARFSGPGATDESNNRKLMEELADVPLERRTAAYVCSIALADPAGAIRLTAEGRCRGLMISEPRGNNGFGYDPYFLVREYHRTFGELSARVKHQISHRARTLGDFVPGLIATAFRENGVRWKSERFQGAQG